MKKLLLTTSFFLGFISFSSLQAEASVILLQDNFDSENGGSGALNYNSFVNWDVTDGTVDLIGNGSFDFFPGNGLYLDMDGTSANAGTLQSKSVFNFNTGDTITLMFDILGQNPGATSNNTMTVSLGSLFSETFDINNTGTITRTIDVTTDITTNLIFNHAGGDNGGLVLDNVKLENAPVPEPLTILGAGTAIAFGTGFKRKLAKAKKQ
ncbi:MAG: PEP-CTERM sorting domain-containing protein [Crocosphaera sp.]|nr:PEP-CTERM sorting domain-containing protein [Crocosphaera sp.]